MPRTTHLVQWYKQLEQGRFRLPRHRQLCYEISVSDLTLLLEGIDLTHAPSRTSMGN